MSRRQPLQIGEWVRVRGAPAGVTFGRRYGIITRQMGEDDWIVRLLEAATHHNADGSTEPLHEILEYGDNLVRLPRQHAAS